MEGGPMKPPVSSWAAISSNTSGLPYCTMSHDVKI
jgi:hypothetical protein